VGKTVLYVVNPISGNRNNRKRVEQELIETFGKGVFEVLETSGKNDAPRVKDVCDALHPDLLMVGGGDGTIRMVASALDKRSIPMGIIPLGSANGLAKCLGIDNLNDAVLAIKKGNTRKLDVLNINDEICLHLGDFGFNAGIVKKFEEEDERGMISYFKSSLSQFMEMRPYRFEVKVDGILYETEAKLLVIANADKYGTGAIINPVGKIDDGVMEIISINPDGFEDMAALSFALFQGTLDQADNVQIWPAREAEILNLDRADFQIDGEVMQTPEKVHVTCTADQLTFYSMI